MADKHKQEPSERRLSEKERLARDIYLHYVVSGKATQIAPSKLAADAIAFATEFFTALEDKRI